MFARTAVSVLSAFSVASAAAPAQTPYDLISAEGFPVFKYDGSLPLTAKIVVMTAPEGDEPGKADFSLSVTLPMNGKVVSADCKGAEYFYDSDTEEKAFGMSFDPYSDDESCTGKFRVGINEALKNGYASLPDIVSSPIWLAYNQTDMSLTVNIQAVVPLDFAGFEPAQISK